MSAPHETHNIESHMMRAITNKSTFVAALRSATAKFTAASLTAVWGNGVQACIDKVKQRQEHYELYRCDCLDRDPGNGHVPGCRGEMMSTHPATFAILDEVLVFLSALQERGASK